MQLVEKYPEMPAEMDLSRERRKQLAELTLENPTDSSKKGKWTNDMEHTKTILMPEIPTMIRHNNGESKTHRTYPGV